MSVDVVPGIPQGSILEPLLFILYTSELFHTVGNHIVGFADDTTIYTVIPRPFNMVAIYSWCSKQNMRLKLEKTKSMVVSRVSDLYSRLWRSHSWWGGA